MNIILIYFAIKYKGDWNKIYEALEKKEKPDLKDLEALEKKIKTNKMKIITIIDKEYPHKLKKAYKPPFVIWIKGDLKMLKNKILCITGNDIDKITKERIEQNIPNIPDQYEILNLEFKGVDKLIATKTTKKMVIVLAQGINNTNKKDHLYISEFPPEVDHPKREYFKQRNRIIAAISEQLILFSSQKNGGINNLVTSFLNLGKEISCFPGDGTENDGNSELIKEGANLITNIKEIC